MKEGEQVRKAKACCRIWRLDRIFFISRVLVIISFDGEGWFRAKEKGIHLLLGCNYFPPVFNMMQFKFPQMLSLTLSIFIYFFQCLVDIFQDFSKFSKGYR